MNSHGRIELLGGLRATRAEHVMQRFRSRNAATLLAYLALHRDYAQPREVLIELLWPDCVPEQGRMRLRVEFSWLRTRLEPTETAAGTVVLADRFGVRLSPATVTTDVGEFEAALKAAERAGTSAERLCLLNGAVEQYGGELLPGFTAAWIEPERQRLTDACLQALRQLLASAEAAGDRARALEWAHRIVATDPSWAARADPAASGGRPAGSGAAAVWGVGALAGASGGRFRRMRRSRWSSRSVLAVAPRIWTLIPCPILPPLPSGQVTFLLTDIEGHVPAVESARRSRMCY